jgi:hypothetical protein
MFTRPIQHGKAGIRSNANREPAKSQRLIRAAVSHSFLTDCFPWAGPPRLSTETWTSLPPPSDLGIHPAHVAPRKSKTKQNKTKQKQRRKAASSSRVRSTTSSSACLDSQGKSSAPSSAAAATSRRAPAHCPPQRSPSTRGGARVPSGPKTHRESEGESERGPARPPPFRRMSGPGRRRWVVE